MPVWMHQSIQGIAYEEVVLALPINAVCRWILQKFRGTGTAMHVSATYSHHLG